MSATRAGALESFGERGRKLSLIAVRSGPDYRHPRACPDCPPRHRRCGFHLEEFCSQMSQICADGPSVGRRPREICGQTLSSARARREVALFFFTTSFELMDVLLPLFEGLFL